MLNTQVEYWKNVETARHNRETEAAAYLQAQASLSQAESAAKTAQIKDFEAGTNWWKANRDYEVALGNLGVAQRNASSNAAQASAALQNANSNAREVTVKEKKLPYELENISSGSSKNRSEAEYNYAKAGNVKIENQYADDYYAGRNELQDWEKVDTIFGSVGDVLSGGGKFMSGGSNMLKVVPH